MDEETAAGALVNTSDVPAMQPGPGYLETLIATGLVGPEEVFDLVRHDPRQDTVVRARRLPELHAPGCGHEPPAGVAPVAARFSAADLGAVLLGGEVRAGECLERARSVPPGEAADPHRPQVLFQPEVNNTLRWLYTAVRFTWSVRQVVARPMPSPGLQAQTLAACLAELRHLQLGGRNLTHPLRPAPAQDPSQPWFRPELPDTLERLLADLASLEQQVAGRPEYVTHRRVVFRKHVEDFAEELRLVAAEGTEALAEALTPFDERLFEVAAGLDLETAQVWVHTATASPALRWATRWVAAPLGSLSMAPMGGLPPGQAWEALVLVPAPLLRADDGDGVSGWVLGVDAGYTDAEVEAAVGLAGPGLVDDLAGLVEALRATHL